MLPRSSLGFDHRSINTLTIHLKSGSRPVWEKNHWSNQTCVGEENTCVEVLSAARPVWERIEPVWAVLV
ncbi:hypothetical protein E3N88_23518 [Mikania micrantha]|uniref:Uncharacterized protein n=1 Tax=Mikania micrantha TaxID=192012 RepID=A0A5N6NFG8_9ASTR|nr:hypothetical protein E3N88_23518 [Mikania micrantha]